MSVLLGLLALVCLASLFPVTIGTCLVAVERQERLRSSRAGASRFIREWVAHILAPFFQLLGLVDRGPRPNDAAEHAGPGQGTPVLLIPGYPLNRGSMALLTAFLRRRGWRWVWAMSHDLRSGPVPRLAEGVDRAVLRLIRATGAEKVDIVAHSAGGLAAAWYLDRHGGSQHVRRLVTLGTPWKGTRSQVLAVGLDLEDIAPGSRLLHALADTAVPVTAIGSRSDHAVLPFENAFGDQAERVEITHLGHLEMLGSARVFRIVADTLTAGHPAAVPGHDSTSRSPSNSSRIDINLATASQLLTLTGIGPDKAEGIVSYRDAHGPFASCDDLEKVDGIGPSTLDRIRDEISVPGTHPDTGTHPETRGDPTDATPSGESAS